MFQARFLDVNAKLYVVKPRSKIRPGTNWNPVRRSYRTSSNDRNRECQLQLNRKRELYFLFEHIQLFEIIYEYASYSKSSLGDPARICSVTSPGF
jgi:hypothetical protein